MMQYGQLYDDIILKLSTAIFDIYTMGHKKVPL